MNDNFNAGGIGMVDKLLYAANTDAGRREEGPVAGGSGSARSPS